MTATTTPATPVPTKPVEKFRKDYAPVPHTVDAASLNFILNEDVTRVEASMTMKPNPNATTNGTPQPLFLNGREDVKLESVAINGTPLPPRRLPPHPHRAFPPPLRPPLFPH